MIRKTTYFLIVLLIALLLMAAAPAPGGKRPPDGAKPNGPPALLVGTEGDSAALQARDIIKIKRRAGINGTIGACLRPVFVEYRLECPDGEYIPHPVWPEDGPR